MDEGTPVAVTTGVNEGGAESPQRGKKGEDNEMVEEEEGEELLGDVALSTGLGNIPSALGHATENLGQEEVEQAGDGGRGDSLEDSPGNGVGAQVVAEGGPHGAEVGEVGEEDGDQDVGHQPGNGEKDDGDLVEDLPTRAFFFRKSEVMPDEIVGSGAHANGGVARPSTSVFVHFLVRGCGSAERHESVR